MAKKNPEGKRFGKEGQVTKKGTTNANRLLASGLEKPVPSTIEDVKRLKKGLAPAKNTGAARLSPQLAAGRALMRLGSRITYPVAALDYGHGVGSKIADKYIEKTAEGKVKLSDSAKKRLKEEEDFEEMEKALKETAPAKKTSQTQSERFKARSREFTGMAKGGMVKKGKK
jgi:hypothetical protein